MAVIDDHCGRFTGSDRGRDIVDRYGGSLWQGVDVGVADLWFLRIRLQLCSQARQIDIARHDIGDIDAELLCRTRGGISLVDLGEFKLDLMHDFFGVVDGQPAEDVRVRGYQRLHLRDRRIEIVGDLRRISSIAGLCGLCRLGVLRRRFSILRGLSLRLGSARSAAPDLPAPDRC